jgi:hypothetical protein
MLIVSVILAPLILICGDHHLGDSIEVVADLFGKTIVLILNKQCGGYE